MNSTITYSTRVLGGRVESPPPVKSNPRALATAIGEKITDKFREFRKSLLTHQICLGTGVRVHYIKEYQSNVLRCFETIKRKDQPRDNPKGFVKCMATQTFPSLRSALQRCQEISILSDPSAVFHSENSQNRIVCDLGKHAALASWF